MDLKSKKELELNIEPRLGRSTIVPLVVLAAATLLLIFSAHAFIYRRGKSIALLWNIDTIGSSENPRGTPTLRMNDSLDAFIRNTFQISNRRALLYEAEVILFDLKNSLKYPDDVRDIPKRRGQSWILFVNPIGSERFKTIDQQLLMQHLPPQMISQIDLIITAPVSNDVT